MSAAPGTSREAAALAAAEAGAAAIQACPGVIIHFPGGVCVG